MAVAPIATDVPWFTCVPQRLKAPVSTSRAPVRPQWLETPVSVSA